MVQDKELVEEATVVVVTYNHAEYIEECLASVQEEGPAKIIVVDSGSTDGTTSIVAGGFPEVTLITPEENRGYGGGNNVAVEEVETEHTVVLNPDTKLEEGCLDALLRPLVEQDRLITTPKILTYDGSRINTCGNVEHYTGLGFTRGWYRPPSDLSRREPISGVSGACFAIRTALYREIGGFDETIFLYMDDVELSWRAAVENIEILYVPEAVVYHDYEAVSVTPDKLYHLEVGRYIILRKYLDRKWTLILLPSLLTTELLTIGYAVLQGFEGVQKKLQAVRTGLTSDVNPIQKDPGTVVQRLSAEIPEDQLSNGSIDRIVKKLANVVYRLNYRAVSS